MYNHVILTGQKLSKRFNCYRLFT